MKQYKVFLAQKGGSTWRGIQHVHADNEQEALEKAAKYYSYASVLKVEKIRRSSK